MQFTRTVTTQTDFQGEPIEEQVQIFQVCIRSCKKYFFFGLRLKFWININFYFNSFLDSINFYFNSFLDSTWTLLIFTWTLFGFYLDSFWTLFGLDLDCTVPVLPVVTNIYCFHTSTVLLIFTIEQANGNFLNRS